MEDLSQTRALLNRQPLLSPPWHSFTIFSFSRRGGLSSATNSLKIKHRSPGQGLNMFDLETTILIARSMARREIDFDSQSQFVDFPVAGRQRIRELESWLASHCRVSTFTEAHPLAESWFEACSVTGDRHGHPIFLRYPIESGEYDYFQEIYFRRWTYCDSPVSREDIPELMKRLGERLAVNVPGSAKYGTDAAEVQFAQRRPVSVSDTDIAIALFLESRRSEAWSGAHPDSSFYGRAIAPHFRDTALGTPFQWALERVQIVNGFAQQVIGKDYPLLAAEAPYKPVAAWACNLRPARHDAAVSFSLSERSAVLLEQLPDPNLPEAVFFVLTLESQLTPQLLANRTIQDFLKNLPSYLDRGLCIDRVTDLALDPALRGSGKKHGVFQAITIATQLFGAPERPWWFHEDQPLLPDQRSADWGSPRNRHEHRILAQETGPLYQYAKEVWEFKGAQIRQFEGVSISEAVSLVGAVTRDYGIGNVPRACNVLDFAIATLAEAPLASRRHVINLLLDTFESKKPSSEIIGALEGQDVNFDKPGIFSLTENLLESPDTEKRGLYSLTFEPKHIQRLVNECARPLIERAVVRPKLAIENTNPHLITDLSEVGVLSLPVSVEHRALGPTATPLQEWLQFDRRLREEVRWPSEQEDVAHEYLTYYAHKFPQPFRPPAQFLSALYHFKYLRDPNWEFSGLAHPRERGEIEIKNSYSRLERRSVISNLLDTAILGLISWDEAVDTVQWMLLRQGDEAERNDDHKSMQIEALWQRYWNDREQQYVLHDRLNEHDVRLRATEESLSTRELRLLEQLYPGRMRNGAAEMRLRSDLLQIRDELAVIRQRRNNLEADWTETACGRDEREKEDPESAAKRAEWERQHKIDELHREVRDLVDAEANRRLDQLRYGIVLLTSLNGLAASGDLPKHIFQSAAHDLIKKLKSGEIVLDRHMAESGIDLHLITTTLREIDSLGLADTASVAQTLFDGDYVSLFDQLREITALTQPFLEAKKLIEDAAREGFDGDQGEYADHVTNRVGARVARIIGHGSKYFAPDAAQLMLNEFFWLARYRTLAPHVTAFIDAELGSAAVSRFNNWGGPLGPGESLAMCRRSVGTAWLFMKASQVYRQQGAQLFEVPAEISAAEDAASNANTRSLVVLENSRRVIPFHVTPGFDREFRDFKDAVLTCRRGDFGKLPVGGKIHVLHEIDEYRLKFLQEHYGFNPSYFRTDYARHSLILPPMPSAMEIQLVANFLNAEQIINSEHPEIQMCLAGRLPRGELVPEGRIDLNDCAVVGSSILLATDVGVRYKNNVDSLKTTHDDETGFRVVIYDSGGVRHKFPFDTSLPGRTDMQGRRTLTDFDLFQLLGSVLVYSHEDPTAPGATLRAEEIASFKEIAISYRRALRHALGDELSGVLDEQWVHTGGSFFRNDPELRAGGNRHFERAIQPLTDAWFACNAEAKRSGTMGGVVSRIETLFKNLANDVRSVQDEMLRNPYYQKQRDLILSF